MMSCAVSGCGIRDQMPSKGEEAIEGSSIVHHADSLPGLSMLDVRVHAQGHINAHFSPQGTHVFLLY